MLKRLAAPLLLAALALPSHADEERFKVLHVSDLAAALKSEHAPTVYDANNKATRRAAGVIPGAHLLSSASKFDVSKELPADKSAALVFYCANTRCMASHDAAKKALLSGYTDVGVMVDGIFGWTKAGQPSAPSGGKPKPLAPKTVAALAEEKGAVIVDVREADERWEVVPGARWMPMSRAEDAKAWSAFAADLPKNETIVFHCAVGARAKRAAEKLASQGFATAYFQGTNQWKAAGLPIEKGPAN